MESFTFYQGFASKIGAMHEKRLTTRLINYWERLKKEEPLPRYGWWNPSSINDIWPNCVTIIATSSQNNKNYKYEYVGSKVEGAWGTDVTGEILTDSGNHIFRGANIVTKLDQISDAHTPLIDNGKFINDKNKVVKYRSCLLPFGSKKDGVTHVVIGLSWKDF